MVDKVHTLINGPAIAIASQSHAWKAICSKPIRIHAAASISGAVSSAATAPRWSGIFDALGTTSLLLEEFARHDAKS